MQSVSSLTHLRYIVKCETRNKLSVSGLCAQYGPLTAATRNSKLLTATSATTNRLSSSARTRFTSVLRLRTKRLQHCCSCRVLKGRHKSSSSTWQSAAQVEWVSCAAVTFTLRFESSPIKRAHLLGSFNSLAFNVARFRAIKTTYLTVNYGTEIFGGEDADGMSQWAGAELSCDSAISRHTSDI